MGAEVLAGRYTLGGILATGGMAMVHLGTRVGDATRAPVAIKRLHQHLLDQTEFVAMFLDEARLTTRLRHPSIVQTLDVVFGEHELFLVMEYLEGETLAGLRKAARAQGSPISIPVAARILHDALEGLGAAHEATDGRGKPLGVVHRDFSPANLMVCADGRSRVLDFGVAKAEGRLASTQGGALKGKLSYMAPEQLLGGEVDARADVFAVGIILWELLTVRRAYAGGDNDASIVARVIAPDFPLPSSLRPEVSSALDEVSRRALAAKPGDRFGSASEMAAALAQATPLASREEVAALVASTVGPVLAERRASAMASPDDVARRAALPTLPDERSEPGTFLGLGPGSTAPTDAAAADEDAVVLPKTPRWPWLLGLGLAALALLGWVAAKAGRGAAEQPPPLASTTAVNAAVATPSASASPAAPSADSAVALVAPELSAAPPAGAQAAPSASGGSAGSRKPPSGPAVATKKASCGSSPYVKGPGGILRVRPECLLRGSRGRMRPARERASQIVFRRRRKSSWRQRGLSMVHVRRSAPLGFAAVCAFLVGCTVLSGVDDTTEDYGKPELAGGGRAGEAGRGGASPLGGSSGSAGSAAGGAGASGQGGTAGAAGQAGRAGSAGQAGAAGQGGTAGQGGMAGQAGGAGKAGSAGQGGGGQAGSAGQASCGVPADCPTPPPCRRAICVDKICQLELVAAGTACADDGNVCNGTETCDAVGACVSVGPVPIDDADACTADACEPATGTVGHTPIDPDDGDVCTVDACVPATGVTHTPVPPTTTCELSPVSCALGFHLQNLESCGVGEEGCACATSTAYRQTCAADCGTVQTFCTPAATPACPAGFHREAPRTCCGGDCAAYTTSICTRDDAVNGFPTCEATCPANYHPVEITTGASSQCASTAPLDEGRRLRCEANTDNFTQCGTLCPAGYQAKNTSTGAECGAGAPNRIRCQK